MISLKANIAVLLLSSVTSLALAQSQFPEKTLVKSFNLQGKDIVILDIDGDIEVQPWSNDIMRVQVTIALPNGNSTMLKSLIKAGRYNLKSKVGEDALNVYAPGLDREVKIRGQKLNEKVNFIVYAPEGVEVKVATEASTSNDNDVKMPSAL